MHARILWTLINHPWHAIEQTAEKCICSAPNSFSERVKPEQKVLLLLSNTILRVFFVLLLYISSAKFTVSPKQSMHVMPLCHNNSIFIICFVLTLCELRDFTQHPIYFFFLVLHVYCGTASFHVTPTHHTQADVEIKLYVRQCPLHSIATQRSTVCSITNTLEQCFIILYSILFVLDICITTTFCSGGSAIRFMILKQSKCTKFRHPCFALFLASFFCLILFWTNNSIFTDLMYMFDVSILVAVK